jgi:hypothetical protein
MESAEAEAADTKMIANKQVIAAKRCELLFRDGLCASSSRIMNPPEIARAITHIGPD